jgi:hypothetical protein
VKRLELSDRDMDWLKRAVWYYFHQLCVGGDAATEAVIHGWDQSYTIDDYITIWKLNAKVHNLEPLSRTAEARVRKLYGKMWRGEEKWQQFAREQEQKHRRWDDEEVMGKRK